MSSYKPNIQFLDNTATHKFKGVFIDPTADVHPNVHFEGNAVVGPYCQIDAGTTIKGNVTIGHHTVIGCNCSIRGTVSIGNYVHILDQVNVEGGRPGYFEGTSSAWIPDQAIIADGCIIGHGTVMHGTQFGEGTVVGMRCAFDYNTRIGKGVIMANGTATNIDDIIPDNSLVDGVPGKIVKYDITDEDRIEYFGMLPSLWVKQMAYKLEERHANNRKLADRKNENNIVIDDTANVHPTAILEGNVKIGAYTQVGAGTMIIGDISIGSYANICLNVVIKGAVDVGDYTHIYDNIVVDGARKPDIEVEMKKAIDSLSIGKSCWLNHGCAVRGTNLGDACSIGLAAVCDYGTRMDNGGVLANTSATRRNQNISANSFAEGVPAIVKYSGLNDDDRQDYFGLIPEKWTTDVQVIKDFEAKAHNNGPVKNLNIHEDAYVHPNAWLEGNITVGAGTYIDAGVIITGDVVIGEHTLLRNNVAIRGKVRVGNYVNIYDQVNIEGGRPCNDIGDVTCDKPDTAYIGDGCWINHGCIMHGTTVGEGAAVNIGAACDYNTRIGKGAIVGNRTGTNVDQMVHNNCLLVGVPSAITQRFITEEDRHRYFGLKPSGWVVFEAECDMKVIKKKGRK